MGRHSVAHISEFDGDLSLDGDAWYRAIFGTGMSSCIQHHREWACGVQGPHVKENLLRRLDAI